jgi:hypothetical protein
MIEVSGSLLTNNDRFGSGRSKTYGSFGFGSTTLLLYIELLPYYSCSMVASFLEAGKSLLIFKAPA